MPRYSEMVRMHSNRVQHENQCSSQNDKPVTSISSANFVPQPLPSRFHFIGNRIFIGNIPLKGKKSEIKKLFRKFGSITSTNLVWAERKKFAFVTYTTVEAANSVLDLYRRGEMFTLRGCELKISRAFFRPKYLFQNDDPLICGRNSPPTFPQSDEYGGVCYNGTVYYPQPEPELMQNYVQPNNPNSNLEWMQQTFQDVPVSPSTPPPTPPPLPPPLPFPPYPVIQQMLENYDKFMNFGNALVQGFNALAAVLSECKDSGFGLMREGCSSEDVI